MRSVGVMGDDRTYDYAVALRAVTTTDFMTADSRRIPWDVLGHASPAASSTRSSGVNRVVLRLHRQTPGNDRVGIKNGSREVQSYQRFSGFAHPF